MNTRRFWVYLVSALLIGGCFLVDRTAEAVLIANSWIGSLGGKWEFTNGWSLGVAPASSQSAGLISDGFILFQTSNTITIDAATPGGTMSVRNLIVKGASDGVDCPPNIGTNISLVSNAGTAAR